MLSCLPLIVAVAYALEGREIVNEENPRDIRPPFPFPPESDCGNETRTAGMARPHGGRSFTPIAPSITTSSSSSLIVQPTLPPVTITRTGAVSISTVFVTSIVTWIEVITRTPPASTYAPITITVERSVPFPSATICPKPTTSKSPTLVCRSSGTTATPDTSFCNGKSCGITFEKGAIVHWELLSNRTPLVTHYLHSTCMDVVCNTTEFSRYYYRTVTSCDMPPCPSNSLNCECNIVVGPIRLPDGRITSV